jgi:hypothetical protein
MVDHYDTLLALGESEREGGTFNCIKYMNREGTPIDNVWKEWFELRKCLDWFEKG